MKKIRLLQNVDMKVTIPAGKKTVRNVVPIDLHRLITQNCGQILTAAITIEQNLEKILECLLSLKGETQKEFWEFFWRQKQVDFGLKVKMLSGLKRHSAVRADFQEWKKFRKLMHEVVAIRNRFAHGKIHFEEGVPFLTYVDKEKTKEKELDNEYWAFIEQIFDEATSRATSIFLNLQKSS